MNKKAKRGYIWVCRACGKMSKDEYGDEALSYGWDVSCTMHAQELRKKDLVIKNGRVIEVLNVKDTAV